MHHTFLSIHICCIPYKLNEEGKYIFPCLTLSSPTSPINTRLELMRCFPVHTCSFFRSLRSSCPTWWWTRPSMPKWTGWQASSTSRGPKIPMICWTTGPTNSTPSCPSSTKPHISSPRKRWSTTCSSHSLQLGIRLHGWFNWTELLFCRKNPPTCLVRSPCQ